MPTQLSPHPHSDRSPDGPHSTTGRTVRRAGAHGRFQLLAEGPGEPVRPRTDLSSGPATDPVEPVLLRLLHLTDFQLADLASPARLEYLQALRGDGRWAAMLPSYRPQEFTATAQVEAMARTVRALAEAEGRPFDLVVTTGDNIDSQQDNELSDFVALMAGGAEVHPLGAAAGGAVPTTGAVLATSADPAPGALPVSARAAAGEPVPDWAVLPDAPVHPGGPAEWALPFTTTGVGAPWVACYGNHDALVQGRARATAELAALLSGSGKPTGPADPGSMNAAAGTGPAIDAYVRDPCCYSRPPALDRPTEPITADVRRRLVQREEFARTQRTHLADVDTGHGTHRRTAAPTAEPVCRATTMCAVREDGVREDGVRPYLACRPHPAVTVLVLDTTNPGGYADGSIGAEQLRWLVGELTAAHSRYRTEDGHWRHTGNPDRAVVLCSHHGLSTLTNGYVHREGDGRPTPGQDRPRSLAPDVEAVLARFPNVVLWLSGHIHRNRVRPVRTEVGGYWEVATSALVDWPCQARCLDFRLAGDLLSIRCRQVDHRAAADPDREPDRVLRLAAIGRRLAANVFDGVGGPDAEGTELDRNVDLLVPITTALADRLRTATTTTAR